MAELLVKAVSATSSDPVKDVRSCWKEGDIIGVAPNGWQWGGEELKPPAQGGKFVVIKITDVTRQQVINWIKNNWNFEVEEPDLDGNGAMVRRRRVRIDINLFPNGVKSTLNTTGEFSTTWATIRQYVRNKLTNQTATDSNI